MRTEIDFGGWFQVRLATDPDPHDDPVGVTGYTWTLPTEPDFDRVIRFQPDGATIRAGCAPEIEVGVAVSAVRLDDQPAADHELIGAAVSLGPDARFEGRNGIVARNGFEPIVPFDLSISGPGGRFGRGYAEKYVFPYRELRARGIDFTPQARAEVVAATGVRDLADLWEVRAARIELLQQNTGDPDLAAAYAHRLRFLREHSDLAGDFGIVMRYEFALSGPPVGDGTCVPDLSSSTPPWSLRFWMGGWDFDALCAHVCGTLVIGS